MPYQVYTEELLAAMLDHAIPEADDLCAAYEAVANLIHQTAARVFKVEASKPEMDMGRCGAPIRPIKRGDNLPQALRGLDNIEEWLEDGGRLYGEIDPDHRIAMRRWDREQREAVGEPEPEDTPSLDDHPQEVFRRGEQT